MAIRMHLEFFNKLDAGERPLPVHGEPVRASNKWVTLKDETYKTEVKVMQKKVVRLQKYEEDWCVDLDEEMLVTLEKRFAAQSIEPSDTSSGGGEGFDGAESSEVEESSEGGESSDGDD